MALLFDLLRADLAARGLVRDPDVPGPLPALWLEPYRGVPTPGAGKPAHASSDPVPALTLAPGIPTSRHEGFLRHVAVDFWLNATKPAVALEAFRSVRVAWHDQRGWWLGSGSSEPAPDAPVPGALFLQESLCVQELQRLSVEAGLARYKAQFTFLFVDADEAAA